MSSVSIKLIVAPGSSAAEWGAVVKQGALVQRVAVEGVRPGDALEMRIDDAPVGRIVAPPPADGQILHDGSVGVAEAAFTPAAPVASGATMHMGFKASDNGGRNVVVRIHSQ